MPEFVIFNYWLPKIHLKLDFNINMLLVENKTHVGHNAKLHNITSKSTYHLEKTKFY